jgi:hypothetical protein
MGGDAVASLERVEAGGVVSAEASRLTDYAAALLRERAAGCFLCRRILEAAAADLRLRDWPPGAEPGAVDFPVESQRRHVVIEDGRAAG